MIIFYFFWDRLEEVIFDITIFSQLQMLFVIQVRVPLVMLSETWSVYQLQDLELYFMRQNTKGRNLYSLVLPSQLNLLLGNIKP